MQRDLSEKRDLRASASETCCLRCRRNFLPELASRPPATLAPVESCARSRTNALGGGTVCQHRTEIVRRSSPFVARSPADRSTQCEQPRSRSLQPSRLPRLVATPPPHL